MNHLGDNQSAADKVLDVLEALMSHPVMGISNSDLASKLNMNAATVTRATQTLIKRGWVSKDTTTNLFRPTARISALTFKVLADFEAAQTRLDDLKTSFTRT